MRSLQCWLWSALLSLCLAPIAQAQQAVHWQANLDAARQLAGQSHRLVLIHFWASGCRPCMAMESSVFSRPEVAQALERDFVPVKVHRDLSPEISGHFGITAVPADVVITPQGQVLERSIGATDAQQYVGRMSRVAMAWRSQSAAPVAQIAGGPPSPGAAGPAAASGWTPPPQQFSPPSPPYAAQAAVRPPAVAESAYRPGSPSPPAIPHPAPPGSAFGPMNVGASVPPPPAVEAALVRSERPSPPPGMEQGPAAPPPTSLGLPPGSPPLALDGYCPVQLGENEHWSLGNRRWGAVFEGRTYLFSGPEEQKKFLADPARYAPALGGDDLVRFVEQQERIAGRREHGAWFHGRVYLFSTEESFQRFDEDPYRYVGKIESHVASRGVPPR